MADTPKDISTTQTLTVAAGTITDSIEIKNDVDWIRFAAEAGSGYRFTLTPANADVKLGKLALLDTTGKKTLASADAKQVLVFDAAGTGDVFLKVSGTTPGDYTVSVSKDDYSANVATGGAFASSNDDPGTFAATGQFAWEGDKDWLKLVVPATLNASGTEAAAMKYTLSAKDGNGAALAGASFRLLDKNGKEVAKGLGDGSVLKIAKPDTYFIEAADNAAVAGAGSYALTVTSEIADDYGAAAAKYGQLTLSDGQGSQGGKIEAAKDADWLKLADLAADSGYQITVTGADTLKNFKIQLLDKTGKAIANLADTASEGEAQLGYGNKAAGPVFLAVTGLGTDVGNYTVSVQKIEDDAAASIGTAASADPDSGWYGQLDWSGDVDWVEVSAGTGSHAGDQEWRIITTGYNATSWSAKYYDATGAALKSATPSAWGYYSYLDDDGKSVVDDSAIFSTLTLKKPATDLFVEVSSPKGQADSFSVDLLTDDYSAGTDTNLTFSGDADTGWTASGSFTWEKDKDWAKIELDASVVGKKLQLIDLNDTDFAGMKFALFNDKGAAAGTSINGAAHQFTITKAGTYYIQIENTSIDVADFEVSLVGVVA